MALRMNESPYQRSPRTTFKIMMELSLALLVVWLAAVIYNFTLSATFGIKAILLLLVSLLTTALVDAFAALLKHKKGKGNLLNEVIDSVVHSYSYVTAIIFTLCLPVYISYYVVIIGSIVATGIKHCFGGFGKNIFNPAIIGRIFVGISFGTAFSVPSAYADLTSKATITSGYSGLGVKWLSNVLPENVNMGNLILGNYPGSLGETFTLIILVLGIVLAVRKVINWRSTAFYLGTVALTSLVIGLFVKDLNPFTYMMYHLCLGGLMFGAVFMITDPVTSPTSPFGKALIGVIAGLLTVLIRVGGGYPEGVMYSIAIINILAPTIDKLVVGKTTDGQLKKWGVIGSVALLSIVGNTAISVSKINAANSSSSGTSYSSSSSLVELSREEKLFGFEGATYEELVMAGTPKSTLKKLYSTSVKGESFYCYEVSGTFDLEYESVTPVIGVVIDLAEETIKDINILENGTSQSWAQNFGDKVKTYIESFIGFDVNELATKTGEDYNGMGVDAVANATYSSKSLFSYVTDASKQYVENDKLEYIKQAFIPEGENYETFTLTGESTSSFKAGYTFTLDGEKHVGYILNGILDIDAGHEVEKIPSQIAISIKLSDDTIASSKVLKGPTSEFWYDRFASQVVDYVAKFTCKSASEIASKTKNDYAQYDGVSGATESSRELLKLVIQVCKQYINNDKAVLSSNEG